MASGGAEITGSGATTRRAFRIATLSRTSLPCGLSRFSGTTIV